MAIKGKRGWKWSYIYFGSLIHLKFRRRRCQGYQAWYDKTAPGPCYWFVNLYFTENEPIELEYDSRDKWERVISELDRVL